HWHKRLAPFDQCCKLPLSFSQVSLIDFRGTKNHQIIFADDSFKLP
ncbi:MAG: hypothetical protein ACI8P3_000425, partial [Saprospiraceae bacterium]